MNFYSNDIDMQEIWIETVNQKGPIRLSNLGSSGNIFIFSDLIFKLYVEPVSFIKKNDLSPT